MHKIKQVCKGGRNTRKTNNCEGSIQYRQLLQQLFPLARHTDTESAIFRSTVTTLFYRATTL